MYVILLATITELSAIYRTMKLKIRLTILIQFAHLMSGIFPHGLPLLRVSEFRVAIFSTSGNESREYLSSGVLTGGAVPNVKAPPHIITNIRQRTMNGLIMKNDYVAPAQRDRNSTTFIKQMFGNLYQVEDIVIGAVSQ